MPCECQRELSVAQAGGCDEDEALHERNLPLVARHKSPSFDCSNPQREKSRPAASAFAESVTIFALHAENGAKWAIFAVYGEFCAGWGGPACVLGEFCAGWGGPAWVLGEFCTGLSMPAWVPGEFCPGSDRPACVPGEFCPGWRAKRSTGGAQVADLLAARHCHIWPSGSAPHGQPGPGLVP